MPQCPPKVCDIARWIARGHNNQVAGIELDSWDRWGPKTPKYIEDAHAMGARLNERKARVREGLQRALSTLDEAHRVILAEAYITLLHDFIARKQASEGAAQEGLSASTGISEAKGELEAWRAFAAGAPEIPHHSTYFVPYDPALHEALFGDLSEHSTDSVGESIFGAGLPDWRSW